jgi:hypothetical protein
MNDSLKKHTTDYHRWWPFVILIMVHGQRHRSESVIVPSQSSLRVSHCVEVSEKEEYGGVSSKSIFKRSMLCETTKRYIVSTIASMILRRNGNCRNDRKYSHTLLKTRVFVM